MSKRRAQANANIVKFSFFGQFTISYHFNLSLNRCLFQYNLCAKYSAKNHYVSKVLTSGLPRRRPQAFQGVGLKPSKALATGFQSAKFENEYAYFLHILPHKLIFIYMFPNPLLPKARIIMHIFAKY